jgi:ABC-type oligopeptide transport system substrate-binding subunit
MIAALLKAQMREGFVAAVRALDRVLTSGFYVIPLFHLAAWIALGGSDDLTASRSGCSSRGGGPRA